MVGSYLDSPIYRQMLAQTMQGGPASQYPGQAVANGLAQALQAYQLKKFGDREDEKEKAKEAKTQAGNAELARALMPDGQLPSFNGGQAQLSNGMSLDTSVSGAPIDASPQRNQLAQLLNSGVVSPSALAPQALKNIGLGGQSAPIKLGEKERLIDADNYGQLVGPIPQAPEAPKAPTTRERNDGDRTVTEEWTGSGWQKVSEAPRYRPAGTVVNVSTEKGYAGAMAGKLADQDAGLLDAARTAPQRIQSAQNVLRILDTQQPITGTGAEVRLALDKALSTAGLVDGKNVTSTENLVSELASQTLDAIKSSGLGSGQGFTDKDRQFLMDAKAGRIAINSGTLRYLAEKNEAAARASLQAGNAVARRLKGDPNFGSVGQNLEVEMPAPYVSQRQQAGEIDALVNKYLRPR